MARIRSTKPDFWTSAQVMACSREARLIFIGMWNFCDDMGRCLDDERTIKAQVLPSDDDISSANVRRWLDELSTNELLRPYTVAGKKYLQVTGWKHQKIDRPQKPKYPAPLDDNSTNDRRLIGSDRKGSEGIGAGEAPARSTNALSEDWKPSANAVARAKGLGLTDRDLATMLLRFGPHYRAHGAKRADWDEQFLAWCADEARKLNRSAPSQEVPQTEQEPDNPLWSPIKQELLKNVDPDVVANWFKGVLVTVDGDQMTIAGPTKFVITYWSNNLFEKIGAAVRAAYPSVINVEFVVASPSNHFADERAA